MKPKIGLEIHQQLDCGKLFCNCPCQIGEGKPDFTVKRQLRLSTGELGSVDAAAAHEVAKNKTFIYNCFNKSICLVELDEEPPHPPNKTAMNIALNVARILNAKICERIVVMRKIVLDGSNTSGFQRTMLVGYNGFIELSNKKVRISTICLEEDAAKIVERKPNYDIYNLSRLGIPLIEISTEPDITSGKMCKLVAEHLGFLLRSLPHMKRGIGTIRQDVNVSIHGGRRVEIKGAQNLRHLDLLVDNEIKRQQRLLEWKSIAKGIVMEEPVDVTSLFTGTECKLIRKALQKKRKVWAARLVKAKAKLDFELSPNHRIGTELSDYAKVKAGIGGLFHSDELPRYGISEAEITKLRKKLKCKYEDGFIIIADSEGKLAKAFNAIIERLKEIKKGVPSEVRRAKRDATTSYLRPMPGHARMYPETDLPLIKPELKEISTKTLTEIREELLNQFNLSSDLANAVIKSRKASFIYDMIRHYKGELKPSFIAETILKARKEIKKQFDKDIEISDRVLNELFGLIAKGTIPKDAVFEVLAKADEKPLKDIAKSYKALEESGLRDVVRQIIKQNPNASFNALMGIAMSKLKGKVAGSKVAVIIREMLK